MGKIVIIALILIPCGRYIIKNFSWTQILSSLRGARLVWVLTVGGVALIAQWALRTWRWRIILTSLGTKVGFFDLYFCNSIMTSVAPITPFQAGEALKVELLKKHGLLERGVGYKSFLAERALDLFTLIVIAFGSSLVVFNLASFWTAFLLTLSLVALAVMVVVLVLRRLRSKGQLETPFRRLGVPAVSAKTISQVMALSILSWASIAAGWQACFYSVSIDIGFANSMAVTSMATVINILSLIPGAIGISEVSVTELLMRFGYPSPVAQAGALMLRLYVLYILLMGLTHWLVWKARIIINRHRLGAAS